MDKPYPVDRPLVQDVKAHLAQEGLMTMFDIENYFNNIQIHSDDQPFCSNDTPLVKFQHTCLDFEHLNGSAIAQGISNEVAVDIINTLIWMGDGLTKHHINMTEDELLNHLERIFIVSDKYSILLIQKNFFHL